MKNIIKQETKEAKEIFGRIKRKDFSGNTGQAIKNSSWQIATTLIAKIGSLIFTIIIARLMLPELYGLYGLALSTILILGIFSDIGIGTALNTFLSKNIDKSPGKAKGYFKYLTKWRVALLSLSILLLVFLGAWLATTYYQKPIYYALLAGVIYLPLTIFQSHFTTIFTSTNNFKPLLIKEIILQVMRITLIPLTIILFLSKIASHEVYLFWVFIVISICYFSAGAYLLLRIRMARPFKKAKATILSNSEKSDLRKFILPLTVTALSGGFFGFIDQFMLGRYVASQFLGFYQASFNLTTAASAIVAFSSIAMFPILARLKGKRLEKGFKRGRNITILISTLAAIFTFLLASPIIKLIYNSAYSTSIIYLKILSVLIISFPLITLYCTYYTSQKQTKTLSILIISSTVLNIILNYIFINIGLQFSMSHAVIGACTATIISRLGYLGGLIIFRR